MKSSVLRKLTNGLKYDFITLLLWMKSVYCASKNLLNLFLKLFPVSGILTHFFMRYLKITVNN